MSFREQLGQIRREYRREIALMDKKQVALETKVDDGFARMGSRMTTIESQFQIIESQFQAVESQFKVIEGQFQTIESKFQAVKDEFSALVGDTQQIRADFRETSRTVTGRLRLNEDRLGKILDLVEKELIDSQSLSRILGRIEALERRFPPA